jgi:hypothetical protein
MGTMIIKLIMLVVLIGSIGLSAHVGARNQSPHEDGALPS